MQRSYIGLAVWNTYSLLWSNIKVPTGVINPVRVILISPRKWSGLGQYQYQTFVVSLTLFIKVETVPLLDSH